jgi:hypothetical protein
MSIKYINVYSRLAFVQTKIYKSPLFEQVVVEQKASERMTKYPLIGRFEMKLIAGLQVMKGRGHNIDFYLPLQNQGIFVERNFKFRIFLS